MKLSDVKWAYGGKLDGYRETRVPGVLVSEEAIPPGAAVPLALESYGEWCLESLLEEADPTLPAPVEMEALLFSGRVRWTGGVEWWEFSTLSSYSVTMWVGKPEGGMTAEEAE